MFKSASPVLEKSHLNVDSKKKKLEKIQNMKKKAIEKLVNQYNLEKMNG